MDTFRCCFLDLDVYDGIYEVLSISHRYFYMSLGQLVLGCIGGVDCKSYSLVSLSKFTCFEGFASPGSRCLTLIVPRWKPAYSFEFLYLLCVISLPFGPFRAVNLSTLLDQICLFNLETFLLDFDASFMTSFLLIIYVFRDNASLSKRMLYANISHQTRKSMTRMLPMTTHFLGICG